MSHYFLLHVYFVPLTSCTWFFPQEEHRCKDLIMFFLGTVSNIVEVSRVSPKSSLPLLRIIVSNLGLPFNLSGGLTIALVLT